MFSLSTLPDLTPRDPHSLWYTALHAPPAVPPHHHHHPHDPTNAGGRPSSSHGQHDGAPHHHNHNHHHQQHPRDPRDRSHRRALVERTALARLRHDESVMERRRANVAGYGSAWLKPAGVPKTLFQLREERRELEEQAEAHRREALLQAQLAEAEGAEGGGGGGADGMVMLADGDEDLMGAGAEEGEEVQDLDDEIPEAEGFGFDGEESDEEEEEDDEEDDEEEDDDETLSESEGGPGEDHAGAVQLSPAEEEEQQVRDMRAAEDRLRQMMAREQDGGSDAGDDAFRDGGGSREGLLEEDDLVHLRPSAADDTPAVADISMGMDMDMDADLDEDIPEAYDDDDDDVGGGGLYEHTDSDEGLSDDDDDATRELSFAGRSSIGGGGGGGGGIGGNAPPGSSSRLRRSVHGSVRRASLRSRGDRESLAQSDMDISGLLSNNDSSFLADSPFARRGGS